MANAAGVPLGDVLVYDAQAVNISGNACITVTMRFTGVDGKHALHEILTYSRGKLCN